MLTQERTANALGGKTARACDSCLVKRARWFCAADDAFLCQSCDTSVHSVNQLARRHERVRLETSSFKPNHDHDLKGDGKTPVWHQGFTRKARTPRQHNKTAVQQPKDAQKDVNNINSLPLVPEIGCEENCLDENEEQELLYRVPVFEPFDDKELNFFFDDVESLLGTTLDNESCGIGAGLGEMNIIKEYDICIGNSNFNTIGDKRMKIEDDDEEFKVVIASHFDPALDSARESFSWDFDYNSSSSMNGNEMKMAIGTPVNEFHERKIEGVKRIYLKLNYEEVITAWDDQGCPWTNGTRPNTCWPDFLDNGSGGTFQQPYGTAGGGRDNEREARVSRYREKRRRRLFSKKIRYEVRKLNAEKRPRMKGRFVKRTSLFGSSSSNFSLIT